MILGFKLNRNKVFHTLACAFSQIFKNCLLLYVFGILTIYFLVVASGNNSNFFVDFCQKICYNSRQFARKQTANRPVGQGLRG